MIPQSAFSLHKTDDVSWQLVMISSLSGCSNYHFQMVKKYTEITEKYLELYDVPNSYHESLCLTEKVFEESYNKPDDIDLLVMVYDKNKGQVELYQNDIGGFYSHRGDDWTRNHIIVICDCPNFDFSDPVWVLSHELSHFILNYKGFDLDVVEEQIHKWDEKYDFCTEFNYDESCLEQRTTIKTDYYAYDWIVMTPYEPAIQVPIFPLGNNSSILDTSFKIKMMAKVTEWWVEGKIKDSDYVSTMMIYSDEKPRSLNDNIILPKTSSVILTESPKKDKGIPKFDDFNKNKNPSFSKFFDDSEVHNTMVLPSWFKTRAELWLSEEISDEKFNLFLNSAIGAIDCKENFEMIIKINGNPSCVKPETVEKLIERGWGMKKPKSTVQKLELKPTKNTTYYNTSFDDQKFDKNTFPYQNPESMWQYREHRTLRDSNPEFTFTSTGTDNTLSIFSTSNSKGTGLIFKTFDKSDLLNRDIKVTWTAGKEGTGRSPTKLLVYDGSYERGSDNDFPFYEPHLQGSGKLFSKLGGVKFSEKTTIFSPPLEDSQLDKVTIFIQKSDDHRSTEYFIEIRSIEIEDLGTWLFEDTVITVEQSDTFGDFGTIEATLIK